MRIPPAGLFALAAGAQLLTGRLSTPRLTRATPLLVASGALGVAALGGVARGSWAGLLPVAGFVWAVDRGQIAAEEAVLRGKFGPEYESYLRRVPRWIA